MGSNLGCSYLIGIIPCLRFMKSSSIPEVLGDAAVLAGTENNGELYKGIESLLFDENLKKKYIDKGYKRVEQFNWETTVNKTIEVYNRLKT